MLNIQANNCAYANKKRCVNVITITKMKIMRENDDNDDTDDDNGDDDNEEIVQSVCW